VLSPRRQVIKSAAVEFDGHTQDDIPLMPAAVEPKLHLIHVDHLRLHSPPNLIDTPAPTGPPSIRSPGIRWSSDTRHTSALAPIWERNDRHHGYSSSPHHTTDGRGHAAAIPRRRDAVERPAARPAPETVRGHIPASKGSRTTSPSTSVKHRRCWVDHLGRPVGLQAERSHYFR
jgi:hypothetical protein